MAAAVLHPSQVVRGASAWGAEKSQFRLGARLQQADGRASRVGGARRGAHHQTQRFTAVRVYAHASTSGSPVRTPRDGETNADRGHKALWSEFRLALEHDELGASLRALRKIEGVHGNFPKRFRWDSLKEMMRLIAREGTVEQGAYAAALLPRYELAGLNVLMSEYANQGDMKHALKLLKYLEEACGRGEHRLQPDQYTCVALVRACGAKGKTRKAMELIRQLKSKYDCEVNVFIFNALLNTTAHDLRAALQVFVQMEEEGVAPDTVTFNTMMKACVNAGEAERALRMRAHMAALGVPLNAVTYGSLISACAKRKKGALVEEAFDLFEEMQSVAGFRPTVVTWGALMLACCRAEQIERAFTVLQRMRDAGVEPNTNIYNLLMSACTKCGQCERTLRLFSEMEAAGVAWDGLTWNTLMKARSRLAEDPIEGALACFVEGVQAGVTPSVQTWGQLIDICARCGDVERAVLAFDQMTATGVQPDITAYVSLMKAHTLVPGNLEGALRLHRSLQASDLTPSGSVYGMLINACLEQGEVSKALEVYGDMRAAGLAPSNKLFKQLLEMIVDRDMAPLDASNPDARSLEWMSLFSMRSPAPDKSKKEAEIIDLHGLSTVEARAAVLCLLKSLQQLHRAGGGVKRDVVIVTGAGRNSTAGKSLIRQAVIKLLGQLRLQVHVAASLDEGKPPAEEEYVFFSAEDLQRAGAPISAMATVESDAVNVGRIRIPKEVLQDWLGSTAEGRQPLQAAANDEQQLALGKSAQRFKKFGGGDAAHE